MQREFNEKSISQACGHYPLNDALFLQGYNLLTEGEVSGKKILEICCGNGDLAAWMGQIMDAEITAIDVSEQTIQSAKQKYGHLDNVTFKCADALQIDIFKADSFDIVVGQAAMHHLSHALPRASQEFSRVLKKGGKCVFIFEPLGHNAVFAALRGIRAARRQWLDESWLFEWAIKEFADNFARYDIYHFNLLAHGCKILPKRWKLSKIIYHFFSKLDQIMFGHWPLISKYAANFNVCYYK